MKDAVLETPRRLVLASCAVDLARGLVLRGDQVIPLTTRELDLLVYLSARPGVSVKRDDLLREVWGFKGRIPDTRAPDFALMRLRAKVESAPAEPRHLLTVFGTGYRFVPLAPDEVPVQVRLPEAPQDPLLHPLPAPVAPAGPLLPPGGPYRADAAVGRGEERALAAALLLRPGAPVVLQGPAGIGKTWLLGAILDGAGPEDRVVRLDLRHLDRLTLADNERFFLRLTADLGDALDLEPPDPSLDPARAFQRSLEAGLRATTGRLLLAIDHADEAQHLRDPSALFALLRALCERTRAPWDRLRLLLAVSTEPALLVTEPQLSPFNLSPPIRPRELDPAAVGALVASYGLALSAGSQATLQGLVGGHPSLVRAACFRAASLGQDLGATLAVATREDGCFGDVIGRLQRVLLENPALADAFRQVCDDPASRPDPRLTRRLVLAGLARRGDAGWEVSGLHRAVRLGL